MKLKSFKLIQPKIVFVLGLLILLAGCTSIKPGGVKSGKNLFQTFYVGEDGTQYFIKPLAFSHIGNKDEMNLDFTFRYKDEIKDSVIVNFTLRSSKVYKSIDSLSLSNETNEIKSDDVKLLFNEIKNDLFNSRLSTKFSLLEFNRMFDNNEWTTTVYVDDTANTYLAEKKTKKAVKTLQEKLFIILQ